MIPIMANAVGNWLYISGGPILGGMAVLVAVYITIREAKRTARGAENARILSDASYGYITGVVVGDTSPESGDNEPKLYKYAAEDASWSGRIYVICNTYNIESAWTEEKTLQSPSTGPIAKISVKSVGKHPCVVSLNNEETGMVSGERSVYGIGHMVDLEENTIRSERQEMSPTGPGTYVPIEKLLLGPGAEETVSVWIALPTADWISYKTNQPDNERVSFRVSLYISDVNGLSHASQSIDFDVPALGQSKDLYYWRRPRLYTEPRIGTLSVKLGGPPPSVNGPEPPPPTPAPVREQPGPATVLHRGV